MSEHAGCVESGAVMDETDGLRDTGEREAAAGSIDEGYGEVSEFIDKSSIDLTRYRTRSNAHKKLPS